MVAYNASNAGNTIEACTTSKANADRMFPRLNKKNILNGIKILTYWGIVSGIIYVHAINNMVSYRKRQRMY